MAVNAFSEANQVGLHLEDFDMTSVVSLNLTNTRYFIIGKVALDNADGDPQNAHVQLRRQEGDEFVILDETVVRIDEAGEADRVSVSVQVGVDFSTVFPPTVVQLACATHDGNASQAQLAAIQLDFLNGQPKKP
jgi:hypothetical protein